MKKSALLLTLVFAAGVAFAQETKKAEPTKPAAKAEHAQTKAAVKTHTVEAEIVSVDVEKKTLTLKGDPENKTVPVEGKALASLKTLKAGEKATLTCRDNEKGEHQAVLAVKLATHAPAKAETKAPEKK